MRRLRTVSTLVVSGVTFTCGALAVATPAAQATLPGDNGRIAFMRFEFPAEHWQVWVANSDLGDQVQITDEDASSGWPVWAPDGSRLAFDSDRSDPDPNDDTPINDVFTMRPDGSDVRRLTDATGFSGDAAYGPDGRHIAFESDRGEGPPAQGIYVLDLVTEQLQRVTTAPGATWLDLTPRFSPDGTRLVFTRYRNFDHRNPRGVLVGETSALFIVNTDGSNLQQITNWGLHPGDADWSPDGRSIAFETQGRDHPGKGADVYRVRPDGRGLVNLTRNAGVRGSNESSFVFENSSDPVWSPDGTTILFLDGIIGGGTFGFGLASMAPDGTDRAFLTSDPMDEHQPDWESMRAR